MSEWTLVVVYLLAVALGFLAGQERGRYVGYQRGRQVLADLLRQRTERNVLLEAQNHRMATQIDRVVANMQRPDIYVRYLMDALDKENK